MKTQTRMKIATLLIFQFMTIAILFAQAPLKETQPDNSTAQFPASGAVANSNLTYKIIDAPNHTFCYDMYAEGRLIIHQSSVPGLPRNEGFKTKEDAGKVAQLVIDKIRKGEMPPTVSIDEMKKLSVIK